MKNSINTYKQKTKNSAKYGPTTRNLGAVKNSSISATELIDQGIDQLHIDGLPIRPKSVEYILLLLTPRVCQNSMATAALGYEHNPGNRTNFPIKTAVSTFLSGISLSPNLLDC